MNKKIIIFLLSAFYFLFFAAVVFAQEELPSPVSGDLITIIANVIKLVLGLVGVLALIFIIYGGITWMTSGGNVERVKKGKNALIWATLGLIVCFLAYSLVTFIITKTIGLGSTTP